MVGKSRLCCNLLYLGEYFFIRFISNNNDSTSVDVTIYSKFLIFSTNALVLPVCSLLKYDELIQNATKDYSNKIISCIFEKKNNDLDNFLTKKYNKDLIIPNIHTTNGNKVFLGWAIYPDINTPAYYPGDTYTKNQNECFYAVWKDSGIQTHAFESLCGSLWRELLRNEFAVTHCCTGTNHYKNKEFNHT